MLHFYFIERTDSNVRIASLSKIFNLLKIFLAVGRHVQLELYDVKTCREKS